MRCTCLYKFTHTVKSLISSTRLIQMCFWRKPHFKARCRRANLTWSVCRGCRAFLFEVAGQLELSDFYHFCLFYFSAVMYTSILPAVAEVVQVSLNRREKERERQGARVPLSSIRGSCLPMLIFQPVRMCTGLFSIGTESGPFPGAAYLACWYWVKQTLTWGCPVGRPARVANESHMCELLRVDPRSWA